RPQRARGKNRTFDVAALDQGRGGQGFLFGQETKDEVPCDQQCDKDGQPQAPAKTAFRCGFHSGLLSVVSGGSGLALTMRGPVWPSTTSGFATSMLPFQPPPNAFCRAT